MASRITSPNKTCSHFCGGYYKGAHKVVENAFRMFILRSKREVPRVYEIQKSGNKTSSGEICLNIRTHASPKVGQDQVSGVVSVLCWHAAPVAYVLWTPCTIG